MKITIESRKRHVWLIGFMSDTPISKAVQNAISAFYSQKEGSAVVVEDKENSITVTVESIKETT